MADLTCYLLRGAMGGQVASAAAVLDEGKVESIRAYGPVALETGEASLFVADSAVHPPAWAGLLQESFGDDVVIPPVGGASAVVVVRVKREEGDRYLAFAFGQGRRLLRPDAFERGFGLRSALNIIFEGDDGSEDVHPERLRSIDAKRVGQHVLRSRHQVADAASLEGLAVDSRRDLLRGVTGIPQNSQLWGARVTGADPLMFTYDVHISQIDQVCHLILDAHARTDYQQRFKFIDEAKMVTDPVLRTLLEEEVVGVLRSGGASTLDLAPPDLIDWERVTRFQYHSDLRANITRHELRLSDYLGSLRRTQVADLDRDRLRSYRIRALDGDGRVVAPEWSVWACLYGEVEDSSKTYLLEAGDFYEVSEEFLTSLNQSLAEIPQCHRELPGWTHGSREDEYNRIAALSSSDHLLLDKETVRVSRHTTAIEICDILSSDRCWIHVKKRSDGSRGLGHLFWQGFVSAELLLSDPGFRQKTIAVIKDAASKRGESDDDPSFPQRFSLIEDNAVTAADHEVVFAIIGKWDGKGLEALPFFSKIALREVVSELQLRGLRVSVKFIAPA